MSAADEDPAVAVWRAAIAKRLRPVLKTCPTYRRLRNLPEADTTTEENNA